MFKKNISEPHFVFLTAYKTSAFDNLLKELEVTEIYEKPLQLEQLKKILFGQIDWSLKI